MKTLKTVWDFVEQYYPNYSSCDKIAENDDLAKIIDGELHGYAETLYNEIKYELSEELGIEPEEYQIIEEVQNRINESNAFIYATAIECYMEILNSKK